MLCDNCKERDAVVQLTQVVGTGMNLVHLCEKCAAERGVEPLTSMPKNPLGDFLQAVQQQLAITPAENGKCSFCSATWRDFRSTGRLGCPHCYATFESTLRDLMRRVHGHSRHTGRRYVPSNGESLERSALLGQLRERLRRAIESEQFEVAAELRDRIKVLE